MYADRAYKSNALRALAVFSAEGPKRKRLSTTTAEKSSIPLSPANEVKATLCALIPAKGDGKPDAHRSDGNKLDYVRLPCCMDGVVLLTSG
jgi:hypothetical protein